MTNKDFRTYFCQLVLICCVAGISGENQAQNGKMTVGIPTTFCPRKPISFEDSGQGEARVLQNYAFEGIVPESDVFTAMFIAVAARYPIVGTPRPGDTVTPLFWSLHIAEGVHMPPAQVPILREEYLCLVSVARDGKRYSFFVTRFRILSAPNSAWVTLNRGNEDTDAIHWINPNRNFEGELTDYVKTMSFGPNSYENYSRPEFQWKCLALRVFSDQSKEENFEFPLMSEEEKEQRGRAHIDSKNICVRFYPEGGFIKSQKDGRICPASIYSQSTVERILQENCDAME